MSSIQVKLDFKQSGFDVHESTKLTIECWETKTIQDIKHIIQTTLNIPYCDQRLFYPKDNLLTDTSATLKSLYLRDGDMLYLEYLAVIKMKGMDELIQDLQEFSQSICRWKEDNMFDIARDVSVFPNYDRVTRATERLALSISFLGRIQFQLHKGIILYKRVRLMNSLKYSKSSFATGLREYSVQQDNFNLEELVDYYNNEQMVLQMHCLSLLWNFSELDVDRKLVLQHNGLQMVCDALLLDPSTYSTDENTFWVINSVNETAVGCLVQYAEFSKNQDILANSKPTVNKLIYMVECRLNRETTFYSLYSSQIAANTLFLCACNVRTPVVLVENEVHIRLIELTKSLLMERGHDMALRYYCCLFLARIVTCPLLQLQHDIIKQVDELLLMFLSEHTPEEVSKWEERHNYVWITMLPFMSIAFAGGSTFNSNADADTKTTCSTWPGTRLTQQMGIFCIDHMSRMKENCLLLVKEKLVPFLTCLKWHLNDTEREILINVFQRLPTPSPPSLSVIAKSQLARMRGLEVAMNSRG
ncbi:hypothetical protein QZH41_020468 [Actinostola sp. cb2023]|nr:hypothetical protein QZH41_020468 [Actinostola sp. cb2023]